MHKSQKIRFDNTFAIKIDAQDHTKKIAIENSIQINKYWTKIGETGALITCWWECKLAHFRWQLAIGMNILNVYTLWASDSTSKNYPTDTSVCVKWYLLEVIYGSIVCNGKKLEKWDALVNSSVVHPHNEESCSGIQKEEGGTRKVRGFKFWYKMLSKM